MSPCGLLCSAKIAKQFLATFEFFKLSTLEQERSNGSSVAACKAKLVLSWRTSTVVRVQEPERAPERQLFRSGGVACSVIHVETLAK